MRNLVPLMLMAAPAVAQNAVTAGRSVVEHTLLNLGFEWPISGDAKRNASVAVPFSR